MEQLFGFYDVLRSEKHYCLNFGGLLPPLITFVYPPKGIQVGDMDVIYFIKISSEEDWCKSNAIVPGIVVSDVYNDELTPKDSPISFRDYISGKAVFKAQKGGQKFVKVERIFNRAFKKSLEELIKEREPNIDSVFFIEEECMLHYKRYYGTLPEEYYNVDD